jgi:hypothetical protein
MHLDAFRVLIFHVYIVADEDPAVNANAAEFVQEGSQG